jgi:hypothetical protein
MEDYLADLYTPNPEHYTFYDEREDNKDKSKTSFTSTRDENNKDKKKNSTTISTEEFRAFHRRSHLVLLNYGNIIASLLFLVGSIFFFYPNKKKIYNAGVIMFVVGSALFVVAAGVHWKDIHTDAKEMI